MSDASGSDPARRTGRRAVLGAGIAGAVAGILGTRAVEAAARGGVAATGSRSAFTGLLNLKDLGAAGDGRTDDTDVLSAALDQVAKTGVPLYVPPGTYRVHKPLVTDVSQVRSIGARIFGAGQASVIDLTAITAGTAWAVINTNASPGAFYFYLESLNIQGNTDGTVLAVGQRSFHDAFNACALRDLRVGNDGSGVALELNYVLETDVSGVFDSAGSAGIVLRQVQFSRLRVSPSGANGVCMALRDGYVLSNVVECPDLEVGHIGLEISSQSASHNGFICPYFNCPTGVDATAGDSNAMFLPLFAGLVGTRYAHSTGVVQLP